MESSGFKMKKTPFGAFLTPALTSCPPAESRIAESIVKSGMKSQWQRADSHVDSRDDLATKKKWTTAQLKKAGLPSVIREADQ
jgi:hypothetical protein